MADRHRLAQVCAALWLVAWAAWAQAARLPDFTELVEKTGAAVVNISTSKKAGPPTAPVPREALPPGAPWDELFKHFFGDPGAPRESRSLGSGFIISPDGYIVTNHHVVKDADEIIVRLQDRRELTARLVGSDRRSDLALLKIEARGLPAVRPGSSARLKVGEWVVAIGSPFGFDHSVTAGIVSAKGRSLPGDNYVPFIQTDVAINPGNSGGPLFNLDGEVVGVNSQIYSRTGGFMGLSFAIPIDVALEVIEQLKAHGKVQRGWLGVQIQDVSRELAQAFAMSRPYGALVARVLPGSPAAGAGIQVGDVIVAYDGRPIESATELPPQVGLTPVGKTVTIRLLRGGHEETLTVAIGRLPEEKPPPAEDRTETLNFPALGLGLEDLDPETRQRLGVKGGVRVRQVSEPARSAGIEPGDVILRVGRVAVTGMADFGLLVSRLPPRQPVALLVQRGEDALFVAIKPDKHPEKAKRD
ncbi:serine protease Do [Methylomarinovum caldicuralii]|uniref:Probable periplasmic serine endoprotease DegP-like n=1 Tax=Methylomarinovum caldicuralii TaxID=438856 RepID=A0AAU9CNI8_9GAMM|nr:DegQ family serine endoprotease [Methylomarinovum caldicuralii]BCX81518.1 serine protease Do [Methylomarinovum caldicuralii]